MLQDLLAVKHKAFFPASSLQFQVEIKKDWEFLFFQSIRKYLLHGCFLVPLRQQKRMMLVGEKTSCKTLSF